MAHDKSKARKPSSITKGRPPLMKARQPSLSSNITRTLIRSHHNLQKAYAQALKTGDDTRAAELQDEIAAEGGLAKYQLASTQGQSADRGGDSSRVLVEWLQPVFGVIQSQGKRLRLLEIGALSTKNACSRVPCLDVRRIDLKPLKPGIEEMDFMHMPVPENGMKFHIISLSLVLNYVPDSASRGAMLSRLPGFLEEINNRNILPCLFLVLPLPCVANSRYLTEERLTEIMNTLGFQPSKKKTSSKLYYSLWRYDHSTRKDGSYRFKKEELRSGASRNNFAITLSGGDNG
jgi:25S rRNA (adenine2142-N1)-methyltransferase